MPLLSLKESPFKWAKHSANKSATTSDFNKKELLTQKSLSWQMVWLSESLWFKNILISLFLMRPIKEASILTSSFLFLKKYFWKLNEKSKLLSCPPPSIQPNSWTSSTLTHSSTSKEGLFLLKFITYFNQPKIISMESSIQLCKSTILKKKETFWPF